LSPQIEVINLFESGVLEQGKHLIINGGLGLCQGVKRASTGMVLSTVSLYFPVVMLSFLGFLWRLSSVQSIQLIDETRKQAVILGPITMISVVL